MTDRPHGDILGGKPVPDEMAHLMFHANELWKAILHRTQREVLKSQRTDPTSRLNAVLGRAYRLHAALRIRNQRIRQLERENEGLRQSLQAMCDMQSETVN